jgi:GTPase SAR1 family protein
MCGDKPSVLVGCKADLRSEINVISELAKSRRIPVTYQQVMEIVLILYIYLDQ